VVYIIWSQIADLDLKSIYDYIAKNSTFYADREIDKIYTAIDKLKNQEKLGKIVLEDDSGCLRELVVGNYRVIYEIVAKDRIDILFIHHGARDLKNRLSAK
jgi:toxin ParE1/3/4